MNKKLIKSNNMNEKEQFIENLKKRTKKFGVDVILFCDSLKICKASSVITYQIVKSATSVGANYRSACRGRSDKEFFSKICIVVEEADESVFWLEVIEDSGLSNNTTEVKRLFNEETEILKITTKSKDTIYKKLNS
jgi:four helix bundle protein